MLYAALIAVVGAVMLGAWLNRSVLEINVLHDRNPLFVQLSDGGLRNGYTVKILNKMHEARTFRLAVEGLEGAQAGDRRASAPASPTIEVVPDDLRALKVLVTVPAARSATSSRAPRRRSVSRSSTRATARRSITQATFRGPEPMN